MMKNETGITPGSVVVLKGRGFRRSPEMVVGVVKEDTRGMGNLIAECFWFGENELANVQAFPLACLELAPVEAQKE